MIASTSLSLIGAGRSDVPPIKPITRGTLRTRCQLASFIIGLIEEGDTISIDIPNAKITLEVSDEVLAERKAKYVAPEPNIKTGWLSRYARMVTSANLGAVLK